MAAWRHAEFLERTVVTKGLGSILKALYGSWDGDISQETTAKKAVMTDLCQGFRQVHLGYHAVLEGTGSQFLNTVGHSHFSAQSGVFHQGGAFNLKITVTQRGSGKAEPTYEQQADH